MTKRGIRKLYSKSSWYMNNYISLGADWLIEALNQIELEKTFKLVNLSANAGYYERDAYIAMRGKGFSPEFILSDICAENLKDEPAVFDEKFMFKKENQDACNMIEESFFDADVVIDNKGALWYSLLGGRDRLLSLLTNYLKILKPGGVLIIDKYLNNGFYYFFVRLQNLILNRRKGKIKRVQERSTFELLTKRLGKKKINSIGKEIDVSKKDNEYPLAADLKVLVISRSELLCIYDIIKKEKRASFFLRRYRVGLIVFFSALMTEIIWFLILVWEKIV